jgi:hypothetical protein
MCSSALSKPARETPDTSPSGEILNLGVTLFGINQGGASYLYAITLQNPIQVPEDAGVPLDPAAAAQQAPRHVLGAVSPRQYAIDVTQGAGAHLYALPQRHDAQPVDDCALDHACRLPL